MAPVVTTISCDHLCFASIYLLVKQKGDFCVSISKMSNIPRNSSTGRENETFAASLGSIHPKTFKIEI